VWSVAWNALGYTTIESGIEVELRSSLGVTENGALTTWKTLRWHMHPQS